jgi:hypothetical protein
MTLAARIQLIVQQHLAAHDEDAMWLRGAKGREWNAAYERCLDAVSRTMVRETEWRDWLDMRLKVADVVKSLLDKRDSA